jgi:hypothetical protein
MRVIDIKTMREELISRINYAEDDDIIRLYEIYRQVKIENHGDNYSPCYVITKISND